MYPMSIFKNRTKLGSQIWCGRRDRLQPLIFITFTNLNDEIKTIFSFI